MITKEEFRKTFIRMMDTNRKTHLGELNCDGVACDTCILNKVCQSVTNAHEVVEAVEKWRIEHPIITNEDKLKKVFGINQDAHVNFCPFIIIGKANCEYNHQCNDCKARFWNSEYKEPEVKES